MVLLANTGASSRDFLAGFSSFSRRKRNWRVYLRHSGDMTDDSVRSLIAQRRYDGIVTSEDALHQFPVLTTDSSIPLVVFGTYREMSSPAPVVFVQNDNAEIGRFGAKYFLQLGRFRTFGFVPTSVPHEWADVRAAAFRDEVTARSGDCRIFGWHQGMVQLEDWLASLPKPAAVMAACDRQALDVIECALHAGLSVPGQISVLGVDNDELLCEFDAPTLSSILPRHDTVGLLAAKALHRLLNGWSPSGTARILCNDQDVVERESTAPLAPATHLITSALGFIRRHARENIDVSAVVRHMNVSRRLADLRFKEFQGETIHETILRVRLEEVKRHLSSTRLPVSKVARLCGFPNASHLGALFRRQFGVSPGRWRQTKAHGG